MTGAVLLSAEDTEYVEKDFGLAFGDKEETEPAMGVLYRMVASFACFVTI